MTIVKKYNLNCDEYSSRYSLLLSSIAIQDVHELFLKNSDLRYSEPVENTFSIDGAGIEIITTDEGVTITLKRNGLYKTFLVELKEELAKEFIYKCIKVDGKLESTAVEDSFIKKIKQLNPPQIQVVLDTIKDAQRDVKMALEKLLKSVDVNFNYNYYEYKSEDNKYESIKVRIYKGNYRK